jgi:hypothetical protein
MLRERLKSRLLDERARQFEVELDTLASGRPAIPTNSPLAGFLPEIKRLAEGAPATSTMAYYVAAFSREDCLLCLRALVSSATSSICNDFLGCFGRFHRFFPGLRHDVSRAGSLVKSTLDSTQLTGDIRQLMSGLLQKFCTWKRVERAGLGQPAPVNLASEVRRLLVPPQSACTDVTVRLDCQLRIHSWDGPGAQAIKQMLEALSYLVQRHLNLLPRDTRRLRLTLKNGDGPDAGYAVLSVETPPPPKECRSAALGLLIGQIIEGPASSLSNGWIEGYLEEFPGLNSEGATSLDSLIVYFPLWLEEKGLPKQ